MNSCPFCGKNVFSSGEFDFRKSIYRILIKNGLEDEVLMSKIVDDVSTSLRENIPVAEEAIEEEIVEEDEDDGIGPAASRKLTPDPRRASATPAPPKANFVDVATREWENAQRIDDEDDKPRGRAGRVDEEEEDAGGIDIPFFPQTSNQTNPKIEAMKQKASQARPGFKSTPRP
jgi:hypothetical protein